MRFASEVKRGATYPLYWVRLIVRAPRTLVYMVPCLAWLLMMAFLIANIFEQWVAEPLLLVVLGVVGFVLGVAARHCFDLAGEEIHGGGGRP